MKSENLEAELEEIRERLGLEDLEEVIKFLVFYFKARNKKWNRIEENG